VDLKKFGVSVIIIGPDITPYLDVFRNVQKLNFIKNKPQFISISLLNLLNQSSMYNTNLLLTQLYVQLQACFCCSDQLSKPQSTEETPILPLNSKSKSQGHLELGTFEDLDEQTVKQTISTHPKRLTLTLQKKI
jgi:hypothetical protein